MFFGIWGAFVGAFVINAILGIVLWDLVEDLYLRYPDLSGILFVIVSIPIGGLIGVAFGLLFAWSDSLALKVLVFSVWFGLSICLPILWFVSEALKPGGIFH